MRRRCCCTDLTFAGAQIPGLPAPRRQVQGGACGAPALAPADRDNEAIAEAELEDREEFATGGSDEEDEHAEGLDWEVCV